MNDLAAALFALFLAFAGAPQTIFAAGLVIRGRSKFLGGLE